MALNPMSWLDALRSIDSPLTIESKLRKTIEQQGDEIQALKVRPTKLEAHVQAREEILVAEAKGAASAVASMVASQHVTALAQSLGRLEGRIDGASQRLSPPGA